LPGAAYLDTIRVSVTGGRVLRVEATPVQREQSSVAQAGQAARRAGRRRRSPRRGRRPPRHRRLGDRFPARAGARAAGPGGQARGRKNPSADVASWWKALDFIGERTRAASGHILTAQGERAQLVQGEAAAARGLQGDQSSRPGVADQDVDVVAVVEVDRAEAPLELEYFIPGARWKPAYDLHFASATGQIRIETAGVVEQTTGEDWTDVALLLSTARPGRGIDLPERLAWTLGERSEFIRSCASAGRPRSTSTTSTATVTPSPTISTGVPTNRRITKAPTTAAPSPRATMATARARAKPRAVAGPASARRSPAPARPSPAKRSILADAPAIRKIFGSDPEPTTTLPLALLDKAPSEVPSSPYLARGQRRRVRLRLSRADEGDHRQLEQEDPGAAGVAVVPHRLLSRAPRPAWRRPRSCARGSQRRQAAAAARTGHDLRRR
jgi:hypothetical protein